MVFGIPSNYIRTIIPLTYSQIIPQVYKDSDYIHVEETTRIDIDINSSDFKHDYGLTLSSFAKEISKFNHYSFPEKTKKLGEELLATFKKRNEAKKDLECAEKNSNSKIISESELAKKRKREASLRQKLYDLYAQIQEDIKKWFKYKVPANIKIAWPGAGEYKRGSAPSKRIVYGSDDPNVVLVNKFNFIAWRPLDYFLYE